MCLLVSDSFVHHAHVYHSNFMLKRTVQIAFIGMGVPVALKFYVVARDTMALSKCSASSLKGVSRVFSAINTALDKWNFEFTDEHGWALCVFIRIEYFSYLKCVQDGSYRTQFGMCKLQAGYPTWRTVCHSDGGAFVDQMLLWMVREELICDRRRRRHPNKQPRLQMLKLAARCYCYSLCLTQYLVNLLAAQLYTMGLASISAFGI